VHCRDILLAASAFLLTGFAACQYNPRYRVNPDDLVCHDVNGCPSGYRCVANHCCNKPDDSACSESLPDATTVSTDVGTTDASADRSNASDILAGTDFGAVGAGETRVADSSTPGLDAAVDLVGDATGAGGSSGTVDAGSHDTPVATGGVDASDAPLATGGTGTGGTGGTSGSGGATGSGGAAGSGGATGSGGEGTSLGFMASPAAIFSGESSTLKWTVTGATTLSLDPGIGSVLDRKSQVVQPTHTTTYTLTLNGSVMAQATIIVLQGSFAPTADMIVGRNCHTATLLQDGKVLIAGGFGDASLSSALASARLYTPATAAFAITANDMADARASHTATLLASGQVLIAGGRDALSSLYSADRYDPMTKEFTQVGNMILTRMNHTATLLPDGTVLIAGGDDGDTVFARSEQYDPATGEFTVIGDMTVPRSGHTATWLGSVGKVLIVGGFDGTNRLSSAELYDPVRNAFTGTGSMTVARDWHTATLLPGGKVLIAGGFDGTTHFASAELYDPSYGRFTPTGNMAAGRDVHTATLLLDGKVLVTGGWTGVDELADAELYDPVAGEFAGTGSMSQTRSYHTATLLQSGMVLIAGGLSGTDDLASVELYQ
jgi:Galactose oxidase, central domain